MVEDAELGVASLPVEVEAAVFLTVEVHFPAQEVGDSLRGPFHHLLHGLRVAQPVAGHHRVVDMLVEIVYLEIGDAGNSSLGIIGVGLVECRLAD